MKIATWNINSVRSRIGLVERFLETETPDVLCLQETKCPDGQFPRAAFEKAGYRHIALNGQKAYHGVATVSRIPFNAMEKRYFCGLEDARHVSVSLDFNGSQYHIHNFYVPAGGDEPDPAINNKFKHKLDFLREMKEWLVEASISAQTILVGDLNIAPHEHDVWSHKQLLKIVSHTPVETELLLDVQRVGGWHDVMRSFIPMEEKLYTWWSYRAKDWRKSNKGRRLDHIWASSDLAKAFESCTVFDSARDWEKPSDHAPVVAQLRG